MMKRCSRCKVEKEPNKFQLRQKDSSGGKKGQLTSKCISCIDKEREYRSKKRKQEESDMEGDRWGRHPDAPVDTLDELLSRLGSFVDPNASGSFRFATRVDCAELAPPSMGLRERADVISKMIGEGTLWRWTCVSS